MFEDANSKFTEISQYILWKNQRKIPKTAKKQQVEEDIREYFKCRCSNTVIIDEEQYIKHIKTMHHVNLNFNSHFYEDNRLIRNEQINQQTLKKLYILQSKLYKLYFCGCNDPDSIFFTIEDYQNHKNDFHKGKPFPISTTKALT